MRDFISSGGRAAWSRDGALIAFDQSGSDGYFEVYTVPPSGEGARCLTCDASALGAQHHGNPDWHPSGEFLAFQSVSASLPTEQIVQGVATYLTSPGVGVHNDIWIGRADGSQFWQITQVGVRQGALHPHFSPDGLQLVWAEMRDLGEGNPIGQWAIKLADLSFEGGQVAVENVRTFEPAALQLYETHGFSKDGGTILFSGIPQGGYYWEMEIFTLELASGEWSQLTRNDEWDEHAHFTPDGRSIVWSSSEGNAAVKGSGARDTVTNPPPLDLWIMNVDGSEPRRLSFFNDAAASQFIEVAGGVGVGDWDFAPDGSTAVVKLRVGRGERADRLVMVDFE